MFQPTNQPETFKFVAFLEEGLNYVNAWTPTEINSGGCGIFAKLLSDELEILGIPHRHMAVTYTEEEKHRIKNSGAPMSEVQKAFEYPYCHHLIEIDELLFDSNGIVNLQTMSAPLVEIPKSKLVEMLSLKIWNETYDHACDKIIKEKLDEVFSHYSDFHHGIFKFPKQGEVQMTRHTMSHQDPFAQLARMFS